MKKILLILAGMAFCLNSAYTQDKTIRAYLSYATFYIPDSGPFIETYLAVEGSTVEFLENEDGLYQATIEVLMIFRQDDDIIDFAKYELKSPAIDDELKTDFGFIDQQRFALDEGEYEMEIQIADVNNPEAPSFLTYEKIYLQYPVNEIHVSGIQLIERFSRTNGESTISKSGYDLIPVVFAFYPESENTMTFYCEIYNTEKIFGDDTQYMLNYFIESFEHKQLLNDFFFRRRMTSSKVNNLLNNINIASLPSGNYNLVVEVRDQLNELVTRNEVFFQRSNPNISFNLDDIAALTIGNTFVSNMTNKDSLSDHILSLAPISTEIERDFALNMVREGRLETMQQYFYNFWLNRNYTEPEVEWMNYSEEVQRVNASFSTPTRKGYDTDRGRVYLQYGPPNNLTESYNEPGAYPYEIWQYYTLGNQRNKRFVFYSKDMVTNDFSLIHSDAMGELPNYRWQHEIYKRTWDPSGIDDVRPPDAFGTRASDYYRDPR